MCFSATASFTVAGLLAPVAAYSLRAAWRSDRRWLGMAAFPLAFGLQQAIEGAVWLGIDAGDADMVALAGRGFLFFSHFFWLAWVPVAVRMVEPPGPRRRWMGVFAVLGGAYGLSIMAPAILLDGWLVVGVTDGSIDYQTQLIHHDSIAREPLRIAYATIILGALFLSSWRAIQGFGALILGSAIVTTVLFPDVFISVWCFFAAVLSAYLAGMFAWRARASGAEAA